MKKYQQFDNVQPVVDVLTSAFQNDPGNFLIIITNLHSDCLSFLIFSIFSFIHFCLFKKFIWSLTSTMVIIAKAYDADFRFQVT